MNMQLHVGVPGEVVDVWNPREAVREVTGHVLGDAERVRARLLEQCVDRQVIVGVVYSREHDLGVVAKVGPKIQVAAMIVL